jgi:hypothetical protein
LLVNGCGGSFNNGSEGDLEEIQKVIKNILPECRLNELNVPDKEVYLGTQEAERLRALVSPLLFETEPIYVKKPNGEDDIWKPEIGERYFNESGDKLWVSLGTPLDAISDWKDVYGKPLPEKFNCWIPNPDLAQKNLESLKVCEQRLDEVTKLGFWIEIRQGKSDQNIQKSIIPLAEVQYEHRYGDYPLAFYKNLAITFRANFDDNNLAGIQNIDLVWKKLTTILNLDLISNYVSNYPETFQQDQDAQQGIAGPSSDGRLEINLGYSKSLSYLSCKSKLVISELNYSVGACGTLMFEIFQADLNTGSCTFLGYWKDSSGNRKIGIVNFCSVYKSGSFIEGQTYEIKVKIDGSTSYPTKLGYENNVLSFSAA